MEYKIVQSLLKRSLDSNKYSYGHVLVVGGSKGMVGAPLLSAEAALRAGAGLVSIASTSDVIPSLESRVLEVMTYAVGDNWRDAQVSLISFITERKVSVVIIGPGLAPTEDITDLVNLLIKTIAIPIIIDGGALRAGANVLASISSPRPALLLTPHLGEFNALLETEFSSEQTGEIQEAARNYAQAHGLQLVVKGNKSFIADQQGRTHINTTGNPGLATAGSGDTLTGIIGAMLGQGLEAYQALIAGVFLHGLAGDIAASEKTQPALIASDITAYLPQAFIAIKA